MTRPGTAGKEELAAWEEEAAAPSSGDDIFSPPTFLAPPLPLRPQHRHQKIPPTQHTKIPLGNLFRSKHHLSTANGARSYFAFYLGLFGEQAREKMGNFDSGPANMNKCCGGKVISV